MLLQILPFPTLRSSGFVVNQWKFWFKVPGIFASFEPFYDFFFRQIFFANIPSIKFHINVLWEPRWYVQTDRHGEVNRHFLRLLTRLRVVWFIRHSKRTPQIKIYYPKFSNWRRHGKQICLALPHSVRQWTVAYSMNIVGFVGGGGKNPQV